MGLSRPNRSAVAELLARAKRLAEQLWPARFGRPVPVRVPLPAARPAPRPRRGR